MRQTTGSDDVGAANRLEPQSARHQDVGARVESQHLGELEDVRTATALLPSRHLGGGLYTGASDGWQHSAGNMLMATARIHQS